MLTYLIRYVRIFKVPNIPVDLNAPNVPVDLNVPNVPGRPYNVSVDRFYVPLRL